MPKLYVISAPSGAGKTSLVRALLQARPRLVVSVSHTTRKPRPTELEGRDYYFISPERFTELIEAQAFLEYARVFDNYYGTGAAQVRAQLEAGHDVLLEIDWQGARQVRSARPDCTSIFILPPSRAALEARLNARQTDSPETIARRLADAAGDMTHYREFDYVVVNDRFETAAAHLGQILDGRGAGLEAGRAELAPLVKSLVR